MRMWLCDPRILCQKHLCGEHLEMHMFLDTVKRKKKFDGYLTGNLFEPLMLYQRHADLAQEMLNRNYNHKSPIYEHECACVQDLPIEKKYWEIDRQAALRTLLDRCPECRKRFLRYI